MTKDVISLPLADLSAFTKSLRVQLDGQAGPPGHLALMNMVARAAGFRNVQHLRAAQKPVAEAVPAPDLSVVTAALRHFDAEGRLERWPAKTTLQRLAVRALWSRLPARVEMTEREISRALNALHGFGDAAILRRTMVELKLVTRTADCRCYCRVEGPVTPEARALIAALQGRIRARPALPKGEIWQRNSTGSQG